MLGMVWEMTITAKDFSAIVSALGEIAQDDIEWSENITGPTSAEDFAFEAIFVICNSGMKNTVARKIFERVVDQLRYDMPVDAVFRHTGKSAAIETIWKDREQLLQAYLTAEDKLAFCASLPWIGSITKYHLAKNFGADVAKPDVHLQRLADLEQTTPQALCERIAKETGYRIATVDVVLWRACANGIINSRTGVISLHI